MAEKSKRVLMWSWLILVATVVLFPLQVIFLLDHELDKDYWCSEAHYSSTRCHEAEGAVTSGIWSLVVVSLAFLVSVGVLLDRFIMPARSTTEANGP